ncbi:uncharacterized protein LOC556628 precursor [Danio rerio]|uniref:Uncharacterized protein LOC556628 precursor n=1 Tax=Danio rerio TaxID=7955 RepID=A0A0R4ID77_DANRE|nr:uncharacterized protein LOC556628 precursor [Danio rerio]|eukprot:XP_005156475.1 uncharacterized protein LOC556628 [Danio rerio]
MYFLTMDPGQIRVHLLLIILICWKHAVANRSLSSQKVQPQQNWFVKGSFGPQVVQSSVLEVPVTASIPSEEVVSVLAGNSPSSHSESMSLTQSAPSALVSSLVLPQNLQTSGSYVLGSNRKYAFATSDGSKLQGASLLASMGSGSSGGLTSQSQGSSSPSNTGSFLKFDFSPSWVPSRSSLDHEIPSTLCKISSAGSSSSSPKPDSPNVSSQSTSSQNTLMSSANTKPAIASPMGLIQFTSGQDSSSKHTLSSQSRVDSKLAISNQYVPVQGIAYSSVVQPQGATIQYAKPSSVNVPVSSEVTLSGLPLSLSQSSLMWQPTKIQGLQSSGKTALQGFLTSGAMQSSSLTPSGFPGSTSSQSQGTSVHVAASPLSVSQSTSGLGSTIQYTSSSQGLVDRLLPASSQSVPVQGIAYSSVAQPQSTTGQSAQTSSAKLILSKAVQSLSPLSINQLSRPQPFVTAVSKELQTSGTTQGSFLTPSVVGSISTQSQGTPGLYVPTALEEVLVYSQAIPSESQSPLQPSTSLLSGFQSSSTGSQSVTSQGSKPSTSFSTLASLGGLTSQSQGTSNKYTPGSSVYVKLAASPLSQSTSGLESSSQYISSSQGWVDSQLAASSQSAPVQGIAYSSVALPQSTSQNALTSSKVLLSSKAIKGVSPLYVNQPSRPQPFVTVSKGLQTSGTIQSGSLTLPSGFSGSTSPQPQGTSGVYTPTAVKEVLMYSQAAPSESLSILQPSTSLHSTVLQGSTVSQGFKTPSTDGTFIKLQETSSQYVPTALDVELPLRPSQGSKQEFLISGPATQWRPSSTSWSPDYETSRTVVSQVNAASPSFNYAGRLSGQFASPQAGIAYSGLPSTAVSQSSSSGSSQFPVLPALSLPLVQSTTSSSHKTPSLSSTLLRPSKPIQAASGSSITSPMSAAQSILAQRPIKYVASSVGSNAQAVSQGLVSVQSAVPMFDSSNLNPIVDDQAMVID